MNIQDKKIPIAQITGFKVTGRYYNSSKRFSNTYTSFDQAMMINLWNGSVWAMLDNGKKRLLKRVS
jgi:hypothetical protein